jgi:cytochrome c oxidase cbb3-type subunit 3
MTAARLRFIGAASALALGAMACGRPPADLGSSGAAAPVFAAVGPMPGPGPDLAGPANPLAGDRAAAGAGRRLFRQFNCSGCHGEHAGGGMGPSLRDVDWIYGRDDAQIFSSIAEGRANGMPTWHTRLEQEQIWRLVAYIKTMRTRDEPEPPTE